MRHPYYRLVFTDKPTDNSWEMIVGGTNAVQSRIAEQNNIKKPPEDPRVFNHNSNDKHGCKPAPTAPPPRWTPDAP